MAVPVRPRLRVPWKNPKQLFFNCLGFLFCPPCPHFVRIFPTRVAKGRLQTQIISCRMPYLCGIRDLSQTECGNRNLTILCGAGCRQRQALRSAGEL